MGGSQIWLKENEVMTVDDLLKATAVYSANDACTALSEYVGGSTSAFVRMMNERAKELGMNDTNFENCTGLDDTVTQHYTSCYDIALMSRELLKHKMITNYTTIWMDTLRGGKTQLVNTNKLIRFYNGATGLKTGTTDKAGCCVSATAERDGMSLIAVVLGSDNSKDRFSAARAMLDWGFANYSKVTVSVDCDKITSVRVMGGTEDYVTPFLSKEMTVVLKRAHYFITCGGRMMYRIPIERDYIVGEMTDMSRRENWQVTHKNEQYRQMTLFDIGLQGGSAL